MDYGIYCRMVEVLRPRMCVLLLCMDHGICHNLVEVLRSWKFENQKKALCQTSAKLEFSTSGLSDLRELRNMYTLAEHNVFKDIPLRFRSLDICIAIFKSTDYIQQCQPLFLLVCELCCKKAELAKRDTIHMVP